MIAYHGKQSIKNKYLARVRKHREADQLVQGIGVQGRGASFRGCAVGCTLNKYEHEAYPVELGVPVQIAHLQDAIFEGLAKEEAMAWPEAFLDAIQPGADLSMVWPRLAVWMLKDLETIPDLAADVRTAIEGVRVCYERRVAGDEPSEEEWNTAGKAARDAWAAWAAWAAMDAWDAWAARDAWTAWGAWGAWTARTAWTAWDAMGAWAASKHATFWPSCRDQLLTLLREAPIAAGEGRGE
jgi:hypothetical protein